MWSPSPDSTPSDTNKPQSLLSVPWSHLVKITCHMSRKEKKNCCHRTVVLCRVSAKRTPNHLKSNISLPCTLVEVLPLQATETASGYRQLGRWGLETPKAKFSSQPCQTTNPGYLRGPSKRSSRTFSPEGCCSLLQHPETFRSEQSIPRSPNLTARHGSVVFPIRSAPASGRVSWSLHRLRASP